MGQVPVFGKGLFKWLTGSHAVTEISVLSAQVHIYSGVYKSHSVSISTVVLNADNVRVLSILQKFQ